jgi:hypothetical protein
VLSTHSCNLACRSKRSAAAGPSSAPPADAEGQCSSCSAPASEVPALFRLPCNHVYCDVCMRQVLHQVRNLQSLCATTTPATGVRLAPPPQAERSNRLALSCRPMLEQAGLPRSLRPACVSRAVITCTCEPPVSALQYKGVQCSAILSTCYVYVSMSFNKEQQMDHAARCMLTRPWLYCPQASLNAGRLPLRCCRVAHDDKFARALLEGERGQVYRWAS